MRWERAGRLSGLASAIIACCVTLAAADSAPRYVRDDRTGRLIYVPPRREATQPPPPLVFDHFMFHVPPGGAPACAALEKAGFLIAPGVNQHEGQGTASVTIEFYSNFLELMWRDTTVTVTPGPLERVARRVERQGEWRTSGWSPFGVGLRRADGSADSLPFPTRAVRAPWMQPGVSIEIFSAADDSAGPRLWVVPQEMATNRAPDSESERRRLAMHDAFDHPNGARALTGIKVVVPKRAYSPEVKLANEYSTVEFVRGKEWRLEVTFDGGRQNSTQDLRPALPLICHF